jgi:hypothetical protein
MGDTDHTTQKPMQIALSSMNSVNQLYETAAGVAKLYASMATIFSSFFIILQKAIEQEMSLSKSIYTSSTSRFEIPNPVEAGTETALQHGEVLEPTLTMAPSRSFALNLYLSSKMFSNLIANPLNQILKQPPRLPQQVTPKLGQVGLSGEPEETLIYRITELQASLDSNIGPTLKTMSSAITEYGRKAIPLTSAVAWGSSLALVDLAACRPINLPLTSPAESISGKSFEKAMFSGDNGIERQSMRQSIDEGVRLSSSATRAIGFAAGLPLSVFSMSMFQGKSPMFKSPALAQTTHASLATLVPPLGSGAGTPQYPETLSAKPGSSSLALAPEEGREGPAVSRTQSVTPPVQTEIAMKEVAPLLVSWVIGQNIALKKTGVETKAIPIAASTAEKIFAETLFQPVKGLETKAPKGKEPKRIQASPQAHYAPFLGLSVSAQLSKVVSETAQSLSQMYLVTTQKLALPDFRVGKSFSETVTAVPAPFDSHINTAKQFVTSPDLSSDISASNLLPQSLPNMKLAFLTAGKKMAAEQRYMRANYRMPAVLALAGAGSLVVQRLQNELAEFTHEVQTAASAYEESLTQLNIAGPGGIAPSLGEEAAGMGSSGSVEPFLQKAERLPRSPPPLVSAMPAVHDTINVSLSTETAEEDLRDLERKISRILQEQMSRYYGSSRM